MRCLPGALLSPTVCQGRSACDAIHDPRFVRKTRSPQWSTSSSYDGRNMSKYQNHWKYNLYHGIYHCYNSSDFDTIPSSYCVSRHLAVHHDLCSCQLLLIERRVNHAVYKHHMPLFTLKVNNAMYTYIMPLRDSWPQLVYDFHTCGTEETWQISMPRDVKYLCWLCIDLRLGGEGGGAVFVCYLWGANTHIYIHIHTQTHTSVLHSLVPLLYNVVFESQTKCNTFNVLPYICMHCSCIAVMNKLQAVAKWYHFM